MTEIIGLIVAFLALGFVLELLVFFIAIWWLGPSDWDDPYESGRKDHTE